MGSDLAPAGQATREVRKLGMKERPDSGIEMGQAGYSADEAHGMVAFEIHVTWV